MVLNALAGASVGMELGLTTEEIKTGIEALVPVSGRNNIIKTDTFTIIDDCYNANPESMKASLNVLSTALTRKVAILGDMGELGANEIDLHRQVGMEAAKQDLDMICCIGTLCTHMLKGIQEELNANNNSIPVYYFETKESFLKSGIDLLQKDDTILLKASNFMKFTDIINILKNK